jgi:hypothetical protein
VDLLVVHSNESWLIIKKTKNKKKTKKILTNLEEKKPL